MWVKKHTIELATDAQGDAIGYSEVTNGRILQLRYRKTDFANGSTMTMTLETSGVAVWAESDLDASATRCPRQAVHGGDGAAAEFSSGYPVEEPVVVANERIKVVVASGGATKTGAIDVWLG